jgi:predicted molibdopterin-dependent oxidoreductase YjgC
VVYTGFENCLFRGGFDPSGIHFAACLERTALARFLSFFCLGDDPGIDYAEPGLVVRESFGVVPDHFLGFTAHIAFFGLPGSALATGDG